MSAVLVMISQPPGSTEEPEQVGSYELGGVPAKGQVIIVQKRHYEVVDGPVWRANKSPVVFVEFMGEES